MRMALAHNPASSSYVVVPISWVPIPSRGPVRLESWPLMGLMRLRLWVLAGGGRRAIGPCLEVPQAGHPYGPPWVEAVAWLVEPCLPLLNILFCGDGSRGMHADPVATTSLLRSSFHLQSRGIYQYC